MSSMCDHFQFSFDDPIDPLNFTITVIVSKPVSRGTPISGLRPSTTRPNSDNVRRLIRMLIADDLLTNPNPTKTLRSINDAQGAIRIDTQPATVVYRNLHIQQHTSSFAVLEIELGGELCHLFGYARKLLGYAVEGLRGSFGDSTIWIVRVRFQRRQKKKPQPGGKKPRPPPPPTILTPQQIREIIQKGMPKFQSILKRIKEGIKVARELAKNLIMITVGKVLIQEIEKAIEKAFAKEVEKEGLHILAKKIPIVSAVTGVVFGAMCFTKGDLKNGLMNIASGLAADLPGLGTAASLTIDTAMLLEDIDHATADEKNRKKLAESDIARLTEENKQIRETLARMLPRSEVYGSGTEGYFDESDLALLDDIVKIHINCGDLIDGIQVEYRHGGLRSHHGGNGGERRTVHLNNGEHVTTVKGSIFNDYTGRSIISSLTFITDYDNEHTFGTPKDNTFEFEMLNGTHLGAIQGYDFFSGRRKAVPDWAQNVELLPAIGFISNYSAIDFA